MASNGAPIKVRGCEICGVKMPGMIDPRALPCGHIFCRACLSEMRRDRAITCPECEEVLDPEANIHGLPVDFGEDFRCDSCSRKGMMSLAKMYCRECKQKMCETHLESHDDLLTDHSLILVKTLNSTAEVDSCQTHTDQPLIASCQKCLQIFCSQCLNEKSPCFHEALHDLLTIPRVSEAGKDILVSLIKQVEEREKRVEELIYQAKGVRDEMEMKFAAEISKLTESRDVQIKSIRNKYDEMERKIRDRYYSSRTQLDQFLQLLIQGNKLFLQERIAEMKETVSSRDHVWVVKELYRLAQATVDLMSVELPSLTIQRGQAVAQLADEKRETEIELIDMTGEVRIPGTGQVTLGLPSCMILRECIQVRSDCSSVCYHDNRWYVGVSGGVDVVKDSQATTLIRLKGIVFCVRIHNERLVLLHKFGEQWTIREHKLDGEEVYKWHHIDFCLNFNRFVIHENIIYIPSRSTNSIKRYTLSGKPVSSDINLKMSGCNTSLCLTPAGHLLLSQTQPSLLACLEPVTGQQIWRRDDLLKPLAVTSDHHNHLLVTATAQSKTVSIEVLNEDNGMTLTRLANTQMQEFDWVSDLCVEASTNTLAVARLNHCKVYFYRLQ